MASSEIEVVDDTAAVSAAAAGGVAEPAAASGAGQEGEEEEEEALKDDVSTGAAYGDLEKLHRLVEREGRSVAEPDALGGSGTTRCSGPRSTTASPPPSTFSRSGSPPFSSAPDAVGCWA